MSRRWVPGSCEACRARSDVQLKAWIWVERGVLSHPRRREMECMSTSLRFLAKCHLQCPIRAECDVCAVSRWRRCRCSVYPTNQEARDGLLRFHDIGCEYTSRCGLKATTRRLPDALAIYDQSLPARQERRRLSSSPPGQTSVLKVWTIRQHLRGECMTFLGNGVCVFCCVYVCAPYQTHGVESSLLRMLSFGNPGCT